MRQHHVVVSSVPTIHIAVGDTFAMRPMCASWGAERIWIVQEAKSVRPTNVWSARVIQIARGVRVLCVGRGRVWSVGQIRIVPHRLYVNQP